MKGGMHNTKKELLEILEIERISKENFIWQRDLLRERLEKVIHTLQNEHGFTIEQTNKMMSVRGEGL